MEERSTRKVYRGVVVSNKMDKTIVVEVANAKRHAMYGKRVKNSTKLRRCSNNYGNKTIICYKAFPFIRSCRKSTSVIGG